MRNVHCSAHADSLRTIPVLAVLLACSCAEDDGIYRKETFPVVGQVTVDGQPPDTPIKITCHDMNGMDQEHPSVSWCMTGEDGKFEISTYEQGDGVPEGEYALTFLWGQMNLVSMGYGGPDRLNGRYTEPEESEHTFAVVAGETEGPIDLGTIELTTE